VTSLVDGACGFKIHLDGRVVTQPRLAQRMQVLTANCVEVAGGEDVVETASNLAFLALPVPTEPALWRDLIPMAPSIHISKVKLRESLEYVAFAQVLTFIAIFEWCLAGRVLTPRHQTAIGRLHLRTVEVTAKDARARARAGKTPVDALEHLCLRLPTVCHVGRNVGCVEFNCPPGTLDHR